MKRSEKISGNEKKRKGKLFHVEMGEEGRKKKKLYPLIGTAIIHIIYTTEAFSEQIMLK